MTGGSERLVQRLGEAIGAEAVVTDPATLEAHAVDGVIPRALCRPADADQIAAVLRLCGEAEAAVVPWGGGTSIGLGNVPRRVDVVLSTERLADLVEHDDANLTATMGAGMVLATLQGRLARRGQFLPIDPPRPDRATVGGVVAANVNGPRRSAYGGVRDLVIGMKMVLAGGERIKAGGKVVKNVAGYDMCKLFVGSLGTLGVITEVTCRMTPLPERAVTVAARGDRAAAFRLVDALFASVLQPAAVAVLGGEAARRLGDGRAETVTAIAAEGFTEAVDRHVRDLTAMARAAGSTVELLEGPGHDAAWAAIRDFPAASAGEATARLTVPLAAVGPAVEVLQGWPGVRAWVAHAGWGAIWLRLDPARAAATFADLVALAASHRGHAVLTAAPPEVKRGLDIWGAPPPALGLMREIKRRFDPQDRLSPGRFVAFL